MRTCPRTGSPQLETTGLRVWADKADAEAAQSSEQRHAIDSLLKAKDLEIKRLTDALAVHSAPKKKKTEKSTPSHHEVLIN